MKRFRVPRPFGVLALALSLSSCVLLSQSSGPHVQSNAIDELSGLAVSQADPGLLWGHNDSGDSARLFRIGPHGEDLGDARVPGASAVDWEDIASFVWEGEPALLIGDIGDNNANRDHLTLYAVRDPGAIGDLKLLWTLDFRYPDGPRDCEGIAVDPIENSIILISKRDHPQHLYRIPLPVAAPAPGAMALAEALGDVTTLPHASLSDLVNSPLYLIFDGPTALDISRSGRFAVVTTYKDAFLYRRAQGQSWREVFSSIPERVKLPHLEQTEAGAISADETALWISGEGEHPPILRVPLPRMTNPSR